MEVNPTSGVVAVPRYPTVGRIVHYVDRDGAHLAAIVTEASPDSRYVNLTVFDPIGIHFFDDVEHDEAQTPGTWHWPERD